MSHNAFHVQVFALGPLQTNSYLFHNATEAAVFDAGGDPAPVLAFLKKKNLTLTHIFCTHLHFDHTYGLAALIAATGIIPQASQKDAYMLESELGLGGVWDFPEVEAYTFTPLDEGTLSVLGTECQVLATPGHTPGGLCYYFPDAATVFVGDTLFCRSVGRSDLPGGNHATLVQSIKSKLFALPGATRAYTGHGESTTIKDEKLNNPFVSDFA